jgi:hypothetical protein
LFGLWKYKNARRIISPGVYSGLSSRPVAVTVEVGKYLFLVELLMCQLKADTTPDPSRYDRRRYLAVLPIDCYVMALAAPIT